MSTYTGKLLRIHLGERSWGEEEIPEEYCARFISARGLGAKYLCDEVAPHTDPLGPENKLLFLIGVLGGTGLQGFSKWSVVSKSPLTGTIMRSFTGGNFGVWMKFAGYDLIVLEGKAKEPTYVYVDAQGAQFLSARDLLGLDPRQVQHRLKERHGPLTEAACIGAAGEGLVRYAVLTSGERTASRGGMGAVMGSKNVKAVSINVPVRRPRAFDEKRFGELVKAQIRMLKEHPRCRKMHTMGTPYITSVVNALGILPVRNFQEGSIEGIQEISGEEFLKLKKETAGCYACMTRCGGLREVTEGPLRGTLIDGPEYESIFALGPLLGLTDKSFIIAANGLCDFYGIDTISTGVCLAFACELFDRGILSVSDTDGLELRWGNKDALLDLIQKIGRREGVGRLLGEGVKRAAQQIGRGAEACAMHIKGLELPGYEPRSVKGYALSMATSNIGGSHMYGRPRDELSGKADPLTEAAKGESIARVQKEQAVEDSLIACTFGNSGMDLRMYADLLVAATGTEAFGSEEELLRNGERIMCLERCFNVREGFTREDDALPERMRREPLRHAGPATHQVVKALDGLLDEYYMALGYDERGIPTEGKLRELRLEGVLRGVLALEGVLS